MELMERFFNYVSFDTQSDEESATSPSSLKQLKLGEFLVKELKSLGIDNAYLDDKGIVYAYLESNVDYPVNTIGFIAHMDTSPDCSGKDIKPRIIENYDGKDIKLNDNTIMEVSLFPSLKRHIGKTLIVTDGTTLLGADDKAGIAEIMTFVENLIKNNEQHGLIRIAFTPDEEVGRGTENFDLDVFKCDFAYTVDGGEVEYMEYENFNAAGCKVVIEGRSVHPGSAKNKMINASMVAMEFDALLPTFERPEYTEGYEGFNHLIGISGACEKAEMHYIIRNHDKTKFEKQKHDFERAAAYLNDKYGYEIVSIDIKDSYYNMIEILKDHMDIVELAKNAINECGLEAKSAAIRGGTDGAMLTYKGLCTPNLGTGGYNFHGRFEYACYDEMLMSVKILNKINQLNVKK